MRYFDEQILEMRQAEREKKHTTLETGIYVHKKLITFGLEQLFDNEVEVMLPDSFIDMPKAVKEIKYTSKYSPEVIKTSLTGTVNITFQLLDISAEEPEALEDIGERFGMALKKTNPVVKLSCEVAEIEKYPRHRLYSYKNFGMDTQTYNLIGLTAIKDRVLQGCFICEYEEREVWESIAKQIILSMERANADGRKKNI